jgi:hypothetical protein
MKRSFTLMLALLALLAISRPVVAQQGTGEQTTQDPLVRLLQSKGLITEQEAASMMSASSRSESSRLLAQLLLSKGVINQAEYDQTIAALGASSAPDAAPPRLIAASAHVSPPTAASPPARTGEPAKPASAPQPQIEGPVTSQSKFPVKLYGNILFNANYVDRGANTIDIPLFPQKDGTSADQNHQNANMTVRQSRFGLRYDGKIFDDAKLIGLFEFDLLGGKPAFANGANFDIFRLRLAYGRIDWAKNSLEAGQDWAVFSPLNPTTLASYAIPGFSTSGNLWNRMPQIRYEHREGEKAKFILTTAVLDPNAGDNVGNTPVRVIGLGERSALPAFEMRLGFSAPSHGKESSAGVSGHYSRLLGVAGNPAGTTVRSPIDSYGVSADANVWLTSGFRITAEGFHGRALGIFSGDIAQPSVVIAGRARGITSTGGWAELHGEAPGGYQGAWKNFSANFGYGIEDNRDQDLLVGLRKTNQTYMANGQYKFSPNFTFALEYRRVLTDWFLQPFANQKLNWADIAFLYSF